MWARENFDGPHVWHNRRTLSHDAPKVRPARPQRVKRRGGTDRTSCGPFALAMGRGERKSPYSVSDLREIPSQRLWSERCKNTAGLPFQYPVRGEVSRTCLQPRWRLGLPLFGNSCLEYRRFETKVSRPTWVSTSNAKQKLERRRVGWDEQQLHRSLEQLILTKLAQRQIHTRPSEARNFSFAVARYEGRFQQCT